MRKDEKEDNNRSVRQRLDIDVNAAIKIVGISGSPRAGWNTELLIREALEVATAEGAETELSVSLVGCCQSDVW